MFPINNIDQAIETATSMATTKGLTVDVWYDYDRDVYILIEEGDEQGIPDGNCATVAMVKANGDVLYVS